MYYIGIAWLSLRKYCLASMRKLSSPSPLLDHILRSGWQGHWLAKSVV